MAIENKTWVYVSPLALSRGVVAVMVVNLVVLLSLALIYLTNGSRAIYVSKGPMTGVQTIAGLLDLVMLFVFVASSVSLAWIYRVSCNAHVYRRNLRISPAAALLWYLVPVASLFKPFQAMVEIWDASSGVYRRNVDPFLVAWWAALMVNNFVNAFALATGAANPSQAASPIQIVNYLSGAVVTGLWIYVVRRITRMQLAMRDIHVFEGPAAGRESALERFTGGPL